MNRLVLIVGWAMLGVIAVSVFVGTRHPQPRLPGPHRHRRHGAGVSPSVGGRSWPAMSTLEMLGAGVRRAAGRAADDRAARELGVAVVAGVVAAFVWLPSVAVVVAGVWVRRVLVRRRAAREAKRALLEELPDTVDLLALATGGGLNVRQSVEAAAAHGRGAFSGALALTLERVERGERLADALDRVPAELGEPVRPVIAGLLSAERYGDPLQPTLERLSAELRGTRRRRAEERARQLPVKLVFPLVVCTLPAVGLVAIVPVVANTISSMDV